MNTTSKENSLIKLVKEFHTAFGHGVNKKPTAHTDYSLRYNLIKEELAEYKEACESNDIVKISDAVIDLTYVIFGTAIAHGISPIFDELFKEVHKSNMSKLDENGEPIYNHFNKIMKGSNYKEPDLTSIINRAQNSK